MDEGDLELRNATYRLLVELGRPPSADFVAGTTGLSLEAIHAGWRRLHDVHALVLQPETTEILMTSPFSAVPTAYRVQAARRSWYANCAWDAFGVCGALHVDGRIETSCPDCGEPIAVEVRGEQPDNETMLFHCLVPAAQWWEDVVFT